MRFNPIFQPVFAASPLGSTLARWYLLACISGFSVACGAPPVDDIPGGDGDGDSSESAGDGDDSSNGGDGDGDGDSTGPVGDQLKLKDVRVTCDESNVGKPVLRRLTQSEAYATLIDAFGLSEQEYPAVRLSPDPTSSLGFTNDAGVLVVGGNTAKELLKTAEDVADLVVGKLSSALPCASAAADRTCAEQYVKDYGRRLFRRTVTDDELARYADYHQSVATRADFATGIKWTTVALIQSPHAFYRSEIGEKHDEGRSLDNFEMASELSYMITGSAPDETLLTAAENGELTEPAARRTQAERLLSSHPDRLRGLTAFFAEWLRYRTVKGQSRVDAQDFAGKISEAMTQETESFINHVVFDTKGTIQDLLTANFSSHNATLSQFYGWGNAGSDTFETVDRPSEYGRGILAQGSLLAGTSHQAASSPTLRGLMFTQHFLCMDRPPPPNVVPTIESTNVESPVNTTREKYEINHRADITCNSCHAKFEPFGYVFEAFDELGRKREMEQTDQGSFPINTVVDDAMLPDGSLKSLSSLDELATMVDSTDDIENCFSGLLAAYMFSGGGGAQCLAEDARAAVAAGTMSIYDYVLALVEAPHFERRKQ